jgi:hypothetical protein
VDLFHFWPFARGLRDKIAVANNPEFVTYCQSRLIPAAEREEHDTNARECELGETLYYFLLAAHLLILRIYGYIKDDT